MPQNVWVNDHRMTIISRASFFCTVLAVTFALAPLSNLSVTVAFGSTPRNLILPLPTKR